MDSKGKAKVEIRKPTGRTCRVAVGPGGLWRRALGHLEELTGGTDMGSHDTQVVREGYHCSG